MIGIPTMFIIHTRNLDGKNREVGMDNWKVQWKKIKEGAEWSDVDVEDQQNGRYHC